MLKGRLDPDQLRVMKQSCCNERTFDASDVGPIITASDQDDFNQAPVLTKGDATGVKSSTHQGRDISRSINLTAAQWLLDGGPFPLSSIVCH